MTPFLLQRADTMCGRRLARRLRGRRRSHDPVHRSRLRDAFLAAARDAHAELPRPPPPTSTAWAPRSNPPAPRGAAVLTQAAHWYAQIFAARPARWDDPGTDQPTERRGRARRRVDRPPGAHRRRRPRAAAGRSLGPPGRAPRAARPARAAARVLRLTLRLDGNPLRVVWVDLLRGLVREQVVEPDARPAVTEWFDRRLAIVHNRAAEPTTTPGDDCGTCAVVAACPEHRRGAHYGHRRDLLPGILHVTPTNLDTWRRCPREWRNAYLFGIPSSDTDPGTVHGQQMHDVLRLVHERGTCQRRRARRRRAREPWLRRQRADARRAGAAHDALPDPRRRARPRGDQRPLRSASDRAVHGHRAPRRAVGARRDPRRPRLQDRPGVDRAASPTTRRPAFRPGWSHRSPTGSGSACASPSSTWPPKCSTTPSRSSPTPTTSRTIEDELRCEVVAMRSEVDFAGVADAEVCPRCRYRSICPDSAVRGLPVWPVVEQEEEAGSTRTSRGRMLWWGATKRCAALRPRAPLPAVLHDGRRLPAVRAALRTRAGLLGGRARDQHRAGGRRVRGGVRASRSLLTVPDVPVAPLLAILVPLMIVVPDLRLPVLEDDLGRGRPRLPPAPRPQRAARRADAPTQ